MMNFEVMGHYLQQCINQFEDKQKPIQIPKEKEEKEIIEPFLQIKEIWQDAKSVLQSNEFYSITYVGPQGSGKTSSASIFAKYAKQDEFRIIYAQPEDFLYDLDGWINRIMENPSAKNCILIDDASYIIDVMSRKNQALLKNMIARLRRVFGGQVFVIYITHRLHAVPPMLRNSGTWIFTNMQSADRDDAVEIIGKSKELKERLESIYTFLARATIEGSKQGFVRYTINNENKIFHWGTKEDPKEGRLQASWHSGQLKLVVSKLENPLDLEQFRFKNLMPIK